MEKILFIHGYGVGVENKRIRKFPMFHAGFSAFADEIQKGDCSVFEWMEYRKFSLFELLSPKSQTGLYFFEQRKAVSEITQNKFRTIVDVESPSVIVCHSMGVYLLCEYLMIHPIPDSLKKVIFVQADIARFPKRYEEVFLNLQKKHIVIENYYCPWDPALATSSMIHKNLRAGSVGLIHKGVKNYLFPLYKRWNLHTSSINDNNFRKRLLQD